MPCCGKARTQLQQTSASPSFDARSPRASRPAPSITYFRYVGTTGITVVGPVSGQAYRFPASGATVATDARDAASLAGVPSLRQVRHP